MARRSPFEHLKPDIEAEFKEGKQPTDIFGKYSQVPRSTIRDWFKPFRPHSVRNPSDGEIIDPSRVEVLSPTTNLVAIEGAEQSSDFALARRTLRGVANDRKQPGAVRVQASIGLMRLIQLRAELPKKVLDEIEESTLEQQGDRVQSMSPDELQRAYKDLLSGTG